MHALDVEGCVLTMVLMVPAGAHTCTHDGGVAVGRLTSLNNLLQHTTPEDNGILGQLLQFALTYLRQEVYLLLLGFHFCVVDKVHDLAQELIRCRHVATPPLRLVLSLHAVLSSTV